jgi:hypothetical protein
VLAAEGAPAPAEAAKPVEAPPAEEQAPKQEAAPEPVMSREEFKRIVAEFGAEIAARVAIEGGDYNAAMRLAYEAQKATNETLRAQLAEVSKQGSATPVKVVAAADPKKGKLFNTGK